ncbi:hypothetical protein J0674_24605, partial [Vibrio parahaemolyticus]|nr:hypothetical protein [Vibrio parahaemolyticus]
QGKEYNMGYYLADGIYSKWLTIVQNIYEFCDSKEKIFCCTTKSMKKRCRASIRSSPITFCYYQRSDSFLEKKMCCMI